MSAERERIQAERSALKQEYGVLFNAVAAALFEVDPMGINFGTNTDEYEPEAGTIIPRLGQANTVQDVETIVREEFCRWFGPQDAGPSEPYRNIANRIWEAWNASKRREA